MSKLHEEVIVIKLSTLLKNTAEPPVLATPEVLDSLTTVAEELLGQGVVVETEIA